MNGHLNVKYVIISPFSILQYVSMASCLTRNRNIFISTCEYPGNLLMMWDSEPVRK